MLFFFNKKNCINCFLFVSFARLVACLVDFEVCCPPVFKMVCFGMTIKLSRDHGSQHYLLFHFIWYSGKIDRPCTVLLVGLFFLFSQIVLPATITYQALSLFWGRGGRDGAVTCSFVCMYGRPVGSWTGGRDYFKTREGGLLVWVVYNGRILSLIWSVICLVWFG